MSLNYASPAFTLVESSSTHRPSGQPIFNGQTGFYSLIFTQFLWCLPFLRFASVLHFTIFTLLPLS
jgi:hypothetical protein